MPYLTTRKNLKLQLSLGLVASYDIQPGNGSRSILVHNTHPGPTRRGPGTSSINQILMPNDQTSEDGLLVLHSTDDTTVTRLTDAVDWRRKHLQNESK